MAKHKPSLLARAAAAVGITHADPEVTYPVAPELSTRCDRHFWPAGEPLPTELVASRANMQPCPKCRRVLLDNGGQAVRVTSRPKGLRWFKCISCGETWKLPDRGA